jgi:hypothetical protein
VGSGNQVVVPAQVPVTAGGTPVAVLGDSSAGSSGTGSSGSSGSAGSGSAGGSTTDGSSGVGSGNQVVVPAQVGLTVGDDPVTVGGGTTDPAPATGTTPGGPGDPGTAAGSPTASGSSPDGPSVLGLHVSAADSLPNTAALAFTGGVPTGLVGLGAALLGLGLLTRGLARERVRASEHAGAAANPAEAG